MDWDEFANFMFLQRTGNVSAARKSWRLFPPRSNVRPPLALPTTLHDGSSRPLSHSQPMSGICMVEADTPAYASWADDGTVR